MARQDPTKRFGVVCHVLRAVLRVRLDRIGTDGHRSKAFPLILVCQGYNALLQYLHKRAVVADEHDQ